MVTQLVFSMDDKELGYFFYQQRIKKKLTPKQVSQSCGIPKTKLSQFENGTGILQNYHIKNLSALLELELKYCLIK